jgi:ubiquinone/menaquinone biosynthesis C-methylase UbiE
MENTRASEISDVYNKFAPIYDTLMKKPYQRFYRERIKSILHSYITRHSKVLDIGCGTGFPSIFLAREMGCTVYGIDISKEMINKAKENIPENLKSKLNFEILSAQKLHLLGERDFNYVTSIYGALNYVNDLKEVLKEIWRHLKKNGYFIASFYSKYSYAKLQNKEYLQSLSQNSKFYSHYIGSKEIRIRLYEIDELISLVGNYFSVVDFEGIGFIPFMLSLEHSKELIDNLDYYLNLEKNLARLKPFINLGMDILIITKKRGIVDERS